MNVPSRDQVVTLSKQMNCLQSQASTNWKTRYFSVPKVIELETVLTTSTIAIRDRPKVDNSEKSHITPTLINNPYPGVENYTLYSTARLGLLPSNAKPLMPEFGPVINDVTSFNYPITVPQCGDIDPSVRSVFIAVISAADNFERRSKIRQT
ncbi:hypothetical protein DAPPUDRAFT_241311 [Daphnia pulex]|uniref:Uncharacterized protein n=1 Tax=Daphnia pulex TaxID=6669 RepID=E9GDY2_DAPPU|nr:hypothetical protein DAPPUDRAFT_241311 [Daphnia pulex]|eukprot:EFX82403.1 hypothetical protein DAPPUDRAFT_241311 [Daphnia pulex]